MCTSLSKELVTRNKQGILLGIALLLLFTYIALATTSSATSDVILYVFDQNPAGSDEANEWVIFHNPSNKSVDIGNWTFESTHGTTAIDWIAEGTTHYPGAYCTYTPFYRWLDNSEEAIIYGIQRVRLVGINTPEIGEEGYAEVMYIPPSEFDSREREADYTPSPTHTPGFELLFAIICVVAAMCLIKRKV